MRSIVRKAFANQGDGRQGVRARSALTTLSLCVGCLLAAPALGQNAPYGEPVYHPNPSFQPGGYLPGTIPPGAYQPGGIQPASASELVPALPATETSRGLSEALSERFSAEDVRAIVREYLEQEEKKKKDAAKEHVVASDNKMNAVWNNGVDINSASKDFKFHVGGRTQVDATWLSCDAPFRAGMGTFAEADAVNFRRARLRADGTMWEVVNFAAEYDFVNNVNDNPAIAGQGANHTNVINLPVPTDLWFEITQLPVIGNLRIGNFKEYIGFEHTTSSRYLNFMERSFLQDAYTGPFNNGFTPGIGFYRNTHEERALWSLGVFKNIQNGFDYGVFDGGYATSGRVSFLPYWDEPTNGRYMLHLGASFRYGDLGVINGSTPGQIRLRSRASLRNGPGAMNPVLADSGIIFGDAQTLLGLEAAGQAGPWSFQAEWIGSWITDAQSAAVSFDPVPVGPVLGTYFTNGGYVEGFYMLTGEHKAYERNRGSFTRQVPFENFFLVKTENGRCWGRGAWQVGFRYAFLNLTDNGINGGQIQDFTLGLNWFLNPNMKVQWNLVWTDVDSRNGIVGGVGIPAGAAIAGQSVGFGMRVAHDF